MKKVLLMSGGVDSFVSACLSIADIGWRERQDSIALFFDYGQKAAKREELCSRAQASHLGLTFVKYEMPWLQQPGSQLTGTEISVDYADGPAPCIVVVFRNANFLSAAASIAMSGGFHSIVFGQTATDHQHTPDNSPAFFELFKKLIQLEAAGPSTVLDKSKLPYGYVEIENPVSAMNKQQILEMSIESGLPLQYSWACFVSSDSPCGQCLACKARNSALQAIGMSDVWSPL